MTLNASRAIAQKPANAVVIDLSQIEEGRVILISRPPLVLDAEADNNDKAFLQALVDNRWLALGTHWPMVRCLKFFLPAAGTLGIYVKSLPDTRQQTRWARP